MNQELNQAAQQALEALRRAVPKDAEQARQQTEAITAMSRALTAAQPARAGEVDERVAPYGYCPECGAPGVMRERRPDGDDKCSNGHRYPSRTAHTALPTQPAQAGEAVDRGHLFDLRYALDVLHKVRCMVSDQDAAHGELGAAITGMRYVIDRTERTTASLPTQPAAQATPEPVGEVKAIARVPSGVPGFMSDVLGGVLDQGKVKAGDKLFTHPAPGVPDVEDLRDRLVAISAAVADSDDRAAQAMLGEILRALAAAQAKGGQ